MEQFINPMIEMESEYNGLSHSVQTYLSQRDSVPPIVAADGLLRFQKNLRVF
jgi:hypothetical protein